MPAEPGVTINVKLPTAMYEAIMQAKAGNMSAWIREAIQAKLEERS